MGQQQLLLVILVTIIVGIATVVAINTFGTAADQANIDAVNNDIATLASAAQGFYMRPSMLGGGGRTFDDLTFQGLAFPSVGMTSNGLIVQNENGTYELDDVAGQEFTIVAHPSSCENYTPGDVDNDNVLTDPATCSDADQITARVGPNVFELGEKAESGT
jgi:Tfp pilus assembly protein PilE